MPPPWKILIVDDHEETLYVLESALSPLGCPLACSTSGEGALKEILRGHVAVVVLDVHMPGLGGLDVLRHLHGVEQTRHIPVILMTGYGTTYDLCATAFELCAADVLTKPVDPWSLRTKVRHLYATQLRLHALSDELRALRTLRGRPASDPADARQCPVQSTGPAVYGRGCPSLGAGATGT